MAVPPPSSKADWRRRLRGTRRAHVEGLATAGGLERAARDAADHALTLIAGAATVALYRAIGSELDTGSLALLLQRRGARLALPRMRAGSSAIDFGEWEPTRPLVSGPFGILQPEEAAAPVRPDLIVTPLLGFDRTGTRLGQGLGCYDRAFAAFPAARRIGYAWRVQEADALPHDPWDRPLHAVVTEAGCLRCERSR